VHPMPARIDIYSLSAKPIEPRFEKVSLGHATGFTWAAEDEVYLITNWHVVTGRSPTTGKHLHSQNAEPDRLIVEFDLRDPIGSRGPMELPLYNRKDGDPMWLEHPMARGIDVVAIPLPALPGAYPHPINLMLTSPMAISVSLDAFIIGYPFGISTGPFPIWKRASIASEPEVLVNREHYFFVDSASRQGMSGAPVIARAWGLYQAEGGDQGGDPGAHNKFLGIYSGRMGAEDELQAQLGRVWHGRLIDGIIKGRRRGSHPWTSRQ
jgi:hypothetical protein